MVCCIHQGPFFPLEASAMPPEGYSILPFGHAISASAGGAVSIGPSRCFTLFSTAGLVSANLFELSEYCSSDEHSGLRPKHHIGIFEVVLRYR